jgi:hypothetical protein
LHLEPRLRPRRRHQHHALKPYHHHQPQILKSGSGAKRQGGGVEKNKIK